MHEAKRPYARPRALPACRFAEGLSRVKDTVNNVKEQLELSIEHLTGRVNEGLAVRPRHEPTAYFLTWTEARLGRKRIAPSLSMTA